MNEQFTSIMQGLLEATNMENNWISCKDKLPDKDGKYLCYINYHNTPYMFVSEYSNNLYELDEYNFANKKNQSGFYGYDSEWGFCERDVDYWMPLPEKPDARE